MYKEIMSEGKLEQAFLSYWRLIITTTTPSINACTGGSSLRKPSGAGCEIASITSV